MNTYSTIKGKNTNIRLWTKPHEVESKALDQLKNITTLPEVKHLAVMPDVHFGKGATVGSVIGLKGAVSPAAVGVDIGCLDRETEFLSPEGWIKIYQWDKQEVLQFDPSENKASFVQPLAYIEKPEEYFYHLKHNKGLDQMICPNHKILFYKGYDRVNRDYETLISKDFVKHHKTLRKGTTGGFLTTFKIDQNNNDVSPSFSLLRVHIMVCADGHIRGRGVCEVHLKKERKISRAKVLLEEAGIDYRAYQHKDGSLTYSFVPPFCHKSLDIFYKLPSIKINKIIDEVFKWDGNEAPDGRRTFSTNCKENADAVQFALAVSGIRAGIYKAEYTKKNWNPTYCVYTTKNIFVNMAPDSLSPVEKVKSLDGKSYCFTVPSGFLVARRNDNIFITGNCGMAAVHTSLSANDLPDNLDKIRAQIEKNVPVGFNSRNSIPRRSDVSMQTYSFIQDLMDTFSNLHESVHGLEGKAAKQLGTLGGGNHFIELCLDEKNAVWFMLHSGSRNIGKTLADYHISTAKKLQHNQRLVDPDLATFLANTKEMDDYRHDLYWAQLYAKTNRLVMMDFYKKIMREIFGKYEIKKEVHCHHNYVSEETHFGDDLFVTRKGAISARQGEMGIIPGSMGTCSYIVRGLGNPDSLHSASHGAGRRMSRSKAKKQFTLEDLEQQTNGVVCRKDRGVLDEIPGAYKNIDQVMENQKDLVEVYAKLKQILCVKG